MNFWQNIRILTTLRVRDGLFTSGQLSVVRDGKFTSRNFSFLHERNLRRDNFLSSNFQLPDRPIFAIPLSLPCMATAAASLAAAGRRLVLYNYAVPSRDPARLCTVVHRRAPWAPTPCLIPYFTMGKVELCSVKFQSLFMSPKGARCTAGGRPEASGQQSVCETAGEWSNGASMVAVRFLNVFELSCFSLQPEIW